jgi:hypothetical protein
VTTLHSQEHASGAEHLQVLLDWDSYYLRSDIDETAYEPRNDYKAILGCTILYIREFE